MNAVKYLLSEHDKVRKMLVAIKSGARESSQRTKFDKLTLYLSHHEKMEQKIWYPFLKKHTDLSEVIKHLLSEEKEAAKKITHLKKIKSKGEWVKSFLEFKKAVEHHAGEEESRLFPKVEKQIDDKELKKLGTQMKSFRKGLDAE